MTPCYKCDGIMRKRMGILLGDNKRIVCGGCHHQLTTNTTRSARNNSTGRTPSNPCWACDGIMRKTKLLKINYQKRKVCKTCYVKLNRRFKREDDIEISNRKDIDKLLNNIKKEKKVKKVKKDKKDKSKETEEKISNEDFFNMSMHDVRLINACWNTIVQFAISNNMDPLDIAEKLNDSQTEVVDIRKNLKAGQIIRTAAEKCGICLVKYKPLHPDVWTKVFMKATKNLKLNMPIELRAIAVSRNLKERHEHYPFICPYCILANDGDIENNCIASHKKFKKSDYRKHTDYDKSQINKVEAHYISSAMINKKQKKG